METVGSLIEILKTLSQDAIVILSNEVGNNNNACSGYGEGYCSKRNYDVEYWEETSDPLEMPPRDFVPCVVLWS